MTNAMTTETTPTARTAKPVSFPTPSKGMEYTITSQEAACDLDVFMHDDEQSITIRVTATSTEESWLGERITISYTDGSVTRRTDVEAFETYQRSGAMSRVRSIGDRALTLARYEVMYGCADDGDHDKMKAFKTREEADEAGLRLAVSNDWVQLRKRFVFGGGQTEKFRNLGHWSAARREVRFVEAGTHGRNVRVERPSYFRGED